MEKMDLAIVLKATEFIYLDTLENRKRRGKNHIVLPPLREKSVIIKTFDISFQPFFYP